MVKNIKGRKIRLNQEGRVKGGMKIRRTFRITDPSMTKDIISAEIRMAILVDLGVIQQARL